MGMNPKTRGLDDDGQIFQLDVGIWGFHVKFAVDQPFFRREPHAKGSPLAGGRAGATWWAKWSIPGGA